MLSTAGGCAAYRLGGSSPSKCGPYPELIDAALLDLLEDLAKKNWQANDWRAATRELNREAGGWITIYFGGLMDGGGG